MAARTITTAMAAGQSGAEEGQGAGRPAICAAGVPAAEMACRVDLGTSVLEGSNVHKNWAMDFGGMVGGGGGNKAGEVEDVLGAIVSGGGAAAAPSQPPEVDGNGNCLSQIPLPCLSRGHHWKGRRW